MDPRTGRRLVGDERRPDRDADGAQVGGRGRRTPAVRLLMRQGDIASVNDSLPTGLALDLDAERLGPVERQHEGGWLGERREERTAERDHLIPGPAPVGVRAQLELSD